MEHIVACGTENAHSGMSGRTVEDAFSLAASKQSDMDPHTKLMKTAYHHADPTQPEDAIHWYGTSRDLADDERTEGMIRIIQQRDPVGSSGISKIFSEDFKSQTKEIALWQTQLFVSTIEYVTGQRFHVKDYTRRLSDGSLVLNNVKLTTFADEWDLWVQGHPLGDECAYKAFWDATGYLKRIISRLGQHEHKFLQLGTESAARVVDVLRTALLLLEALCYSTPAGQYDRIENSALRKAGLKSRADYQPDSWLSRVTRKVRDALGFPSEAYTAGGLRYANIFHCTRPDLTETDSSESFRRMERHMEMENKCAAQAHVELLGIDNALCQPWIRRLRQRGYCPSHFERLRIVGGFSLVELACLIDNSPAVREEDHSNCSLQNCVLETIDTSNYQARHQTHDCTCAYAKPVLQDVKAILDEGGFPLIDCYALLDRPENAVKKWQPGMRFTAISHVWADGLGSTTEAGLPRCQIEYIGHQAWLNMFQMFDPDSDDPAENAANLTRLVWIDSLCIPADNEYRKKAIARMQTTYTEAYVTLVLDSGLNSLDPSVAWEAPNTQLLRILTSKWMGRMWTFQEAFTATKLTIQFGDKHWTGVNLIVQNLMKLRAPATPVNQALMWHFCSYAAIAPYNKDHAPTIAQLSRHLRSRQTSKTADEAFIIAGLMKLDLDKLLPLDDAVSRNKELWKMMAEELPRGMIFDDGPRLEPPGSGFGWCPKSLLHNRLGQAMRQGGEARAQFVGLGLLGRYWLLRMSSTIHISPTFQTEIEWIADNGQRITIAVTAKPLDGAEFDLDALVFLEPPSILTDPVKAIAAVHCRNIAIQTDDGETPLPEKVARNAYQHARFVYIVSPELWQTAQNVKGRQKVVATAEMENLIFV